MIFITADSASLAFGLLFSQKIDLEASFWSLTSCDEPYSQFLDIFIAKIIIIFFGKKRLNTEIVIMSIIVSCTYTHNSFHCSALNVNSQLNLVLYIYIVLVVDQ